MLRKRVTLYPNALLLGNASTSRAEKRTTNFSEVASQDALLLRWEKVCVVSRGISLLLEALREITRLIPQGRRQRRAWDRTTALMPLLSCCKNLLNRSPQYCTYVSTSRCLNVTIIWQEEIIFNKFILF